MADCLSDSNGLRGQASLELIASLGFLILTFAVMVLLTIDKTSESSELKTALDVKRIGESIKDNINMVSEQGPGYYRFFSIPAEIKGGYEYNVSVYGNTLYITWNHRLSPWSTQLVTSNVSILDLRKGMTDRNCVINEDGVLKIKQTCGRVSILVYEFGGGRDSTLLSNLSGLCELAVYNTSYADNLTYDNLKEYDILWIGFDSISGAVYTLDPTSENAIKQFVQDGGLVWSSSQSKVSWSSGWLPYAVNVETSNDEDITPTADAGVLFEYPNSLVLQGLTTSEHYNGWTAEYTPLATQDGNASKGHFLRLNYGSGMYLLSTLDTRASMPDYDGNNTLMFMNVLDYMTPHSKC